MLKQVLKLVVQVTKWFLQFLRVSLWRLTPSVKLSTVLLGHITCMQCIVTVCGLLLQMSHVAWSVSCLSAFHVSVCWAHGQAVYKRLNQSRCHLGEGDSCESKKQCIRWIQITCGKGGTFEEGRDQLIVTYLCMNALCLTRANVPAHCQVHAAYEYISCRKEWLDYTAMWPLAK